MKYLGILGALAIIYLVVAQMGSTNSGVKSSVAESIAEADKVNPVAKPATAAAPAATPAPAQTSLRAPIDRARALNGIVKQRNGAGEF
jgi:hypothetical protein